MAVTGGVSLVASVADSLNRAHVNTGVASSTLQQQYDRMRLLENLGYRNRVFLHWDGGPQGYGSVSAYMGLYAAIVGLLPHGRFVIVPPVRRTVNGDTVNADTTLIQEAVAEAYPDNYVDAQSILMALADPVDDAEAIAANVIPASLLQEDGAHLTQAAMTAVAEEVASIITSRGW